MKVKSYDIILRHVEGYGWLPIIERDGKEIYRGEYWYSGHRALLAAEEWLNDRQEEA